jgi:hypothetical protein
LSWAQRPFDIIFPLSVALDQLTSFNVDELGARLRLTWPSIIEARRYTAQIQADIAARIVSSVPADTSLVVFGSQARKEATPESDVDWALLIDGQAYASHHTAALEIDREVVALDLSKPGVEGTFGGLVFSHDLIHYIGGEPDTNANTTRRLLLLLESAAIGPSEVRARVIHQVLKRYVAEDFGLLLAQTEGVPRFLLNDIVRFWRTMAVDFAYKRRARQAKGWALRTVKLRLSRKLTYVAGLLACYSCAGLGTLEGCDMEERPLRVVDHLATFLRQTPLEMLAGTLLTHLAEPGFEQAARDLFNSYDAFLAMISDENQRETLRDLPPEAAATDPLYNRARDLGHVFQRGLTTLFLDPNATPLHRLTRSYGVF